MTASTALIGHDTWADGRLGNYATSSFELNDFYLIEDFVGADQAGRLTIL